MMALARRTSVLALWSRMGDIDAKGPTSLGVGTRSLAISSVTFGAFLFLKNAALIENAQKQPGVRR